MLVFPLLTILSAHLLFRVQLQIISMNYHYFHRDFRISFCFGDYRNYISFQINLNLSQIIIPSDNFKESYTTTLKKQSETSNMIDGKTFNFTSCTDNLIINIDSMVLKDYPFILIKNDYNSFKNTKTGFGFGYKFIDYNYSLVHQLQRHSLISKLIFTFDYYDVLESRGHLYFGGVPKRIIESTFNSSCNVDRSYSSWGCVMTSLIIKYPDKSKEIVCVLNKYASFQSKNEYINLPYSWMLWIVNVGWNDFFKRGECWFLDKNNMFYIDCMNNVLYDLPELTFDFQGWVLSVKMKDVFVCSLMETCSSAIINEKGLEQWVIGTIFLSHFIVSFDYDNSVITFYQDSEFEIRVNLSLQLQKSFYLWSSCLLGIGVVIIMYVNKKRNL